MLVEIFFFTIRHSGHKGNMFTSRGRSSKHIHVLHAITMMTLTVTESNVNEHNQLRDEYHQQLILKLTIIQVFIHARHIRQ